MLSILRYTKGLHLQSNFTNVSDFRMDNHHSATSAILNLNGFIMGGFALRVSWAKEKFGWQNYMLPTPYVIQYPVVYNNLPIAYPFANAYMVNNPMPQGNKENKENIPSNHPSQI